jgi:hypothetical protein
MLDGYALPYEHGGDIGIVFRRYDIALLFARDFDIFRFGHHAAGADDEPRAAFDGLADVL